MDTTVTEGLETRSSGSAIVPPQVRLAFPQPLRKFCCARNMALAGVVLLSIGSLLLTGCRLIGGTDATLEQAAPPPATTVPRSVKPPPSPAPQPQPLSRPAPSQPPQLAEAKRPLAATSNKGAEKLVAPSTPALPRSEATASHSAEAKPGVSTSTKEAASVSSGSARELVFKGPPRVMRPKAAGQKGWVWLGLALSAAVLGFGTPILLKRRHKSPKQSKSDKEELVMPKEFLLKEPAPYRKETMTFD
jgi:hypothetical protein